MRDIYEELASRIVDGFGKYVDCGDGWKQLLTDLHEQLLVTDPTYRLHQVKEKFGGLRFYTANMLSDEGEAAIRAAEAKSILTCEDCGEPGEKVGKYWLRTLCPLHQEEKP